MGSIANILSVKREGDDDIRQEESQGYFEKTPRTVIISPQEKVVMRKRRRRRESNLHHHHGNYVSNWKVDGSLPMDFCLHSSLHGLKYIGERGQHFVERMFWSLAFTVGLVVACIMISDVWEKYKSNSVIITFAPYDTKIEELPFPAVTICNMNKILKSKAIKIMDDAKGFSGLDKKTEALENLYYLNHVCSTSKSFSKVFNYSSERGKIDKKILNKANMNEAIYDGGKEDLWKFFKRASPLCSEMILKCIWEKEVRNCTELFTPLETDNGKCCTFNMVPPSILHRFNMSGIREDPTIADNWEWDGESLIKSRRKYSDSYPNFPRRQKIAGQSFGLSILLNPGLEEYFCTSSDSHGFRITAHPPIDVPHISDFGLAIRPNSEVFINIRPEVTIADKATIGSFPATQRECYFPGERDLSYYTFYTAKNCIDECLANLTYQECNCRRHYQPGEDSKPLCGPKAFHCASNIKRKFVGNFKTKCNMCIPTCNEITYHTETTYTPLQDPKQLWTSEDESESYLAPWAEKNCSIIHIYFGEDSTNAKLRKELYGVIDLIANFGGLMGLCLGFSGLSLIEVIYFLTLRAWCRVRRERRERFNQIPHCQQLQKNVGGYETTNKSLKRTETTTELIEDDEEDIDEPRRGMGDNHDDSGSGDYLEMKAIGVVPNGATATSQIPTISSVVKEKFGLGLRGRPPTPTNRKNGDLRHHHFLMNVDQELASVRIDDLLRSDSLKKMKKNIGETKEKREETPQPLGVENIAFEKVNEGNDKFIQRFTMNL